MRSEFVNTPEFKNVRKPIKLLYKWFQMVWLTTVFVRSPRILNTDLPTICNHSSTNLSHHEPAFYVFFWTVVPCRISKLPLCFPCTIGCSNNYLRKPLSPVPTCKRNAGAFRTSWTTRHLQSNSWSCLFFPRTWGKWDLVHKNMSQYGWV